MKIKNPKVMILSLIAIAFVILTFTVHWLFIIGAVILAGINQRILMKNRPKE